MLVSPATPRSLTTVASSSATASPAGTVIAIASDDSDERARTTSRSLGVGRGAAATTQSAPAPTPSAAPATPAPTPTVDDARTFALAQIGPAQFDCLDALWQHESDWDPSAENPSSGAYGIAQALPAGKMASVGADWMSNPITQVTWGLQYIESRYGSACNAWAFWLRHYPHWY